MKWTVKRGFLVGLVLVAAFGIAACGSSSSPSALLPGDGNGDGNGDGTGTFSFFESLNDNLALRVGIITPVPQG